MNPERCHCPNCAPITQEAIKTEYLAHKDDNQAKLIAELRLKVERLEQQLANQHKEPKNARKQKHV